MDHIYRKFASLEVWLSCFYWNLNVNTADYCFTSVGVVTGDIAIAVSSVVIKLEERHIG